jgi:hypothetical protein
MEKLKLIAIGLISGSVAVLAIWITRAVLAPRETSLPEVIRLDMLDAYAARPSADPRALLKDDRILERIVDRFEVVAVSRRDALTRLSELAKTSIVIDPNFRNEATDEYLNNFSVSLSLQSATVDQILEQLFREEVPDNFEQPVWLVRNGTVLIASNIRHSDAAFVLRAYDVRDLMLESRRVSSGFPTTTRPSSDKWDAIVLHGSEQEAAERLSIALRGGEETWDEKRIDIQYFAGRLLVRASRVSHRLVENRLALLRKVD